MSMLRRVTMTMLLVMVAGCAGRLRPPQDVLEVQDIVSHHVKITQINKGQPTSWGSGVAVAVRGIPGAILTAGHVCRADAGPAPAFLLEDAFGHQSAALVVRVDERLDLCLMTSHLALAPAQIAAAAPRPGQTVLSIVGVFFDDQAQPITVHRVAGEHVIMGQGRGLVTPSFYPGDSGGGAYLGGRLVGIVIATIEHPSTRDDCLGVMTRWQDMIAFLRG